MIFETERLLVRKLVLKDLQPFYALESNPLVLQYATGEVKTVEECKKELHELIRKYNIKDNDFWIYAIEHKKTKSFLGTLALVKDEQNEDEIGYRFIREYWGNGLGYEICEGLIAYAKQIKMIKLIGNVVNENIASAKILEKLNFKPVHQFVSKDIGLPETKYELKL